MKRFLLLLLLLLIFTSSALADIKTTVPKSLQNNLVKIENGNFLISKYLSCSLRLPPSLGGGTPFNRFSIHVRFTAPAQRLISRDIFVALSMRLFTEARIRLAAEIPGLSTSQTLRVMQCNEVSQQTDDIQYSYFVDMSNQGVESRITDKQRGSEQISKESWETVLNILPKTQ